MAKVSACPITVAMAASFTTILNAKTKSSDCVSKNWTYAHRCSFMEVTKNFSFFSDNFKNAML